MSDDFAPSLEERFEAHAKAMRTEVRLQRVYLSEMHADLTARYDDIHIAVDALRAEMVEVLDALRAEVVAGFVALGERLDRLEHRP